MKGEIKLNKKKRRSDLFEESIFEKGFKKGQNTVLSLHHSTEIYSAEAKVSSLVKRFRA